MTKRSIYFGILIGVILAWVIHGVMLVIFTEQYFAAGVAWQFLAIQVVSIPVFLWSCKMLAVMEANDD